MCVILFQLVALTLQWKSARLLSGGASPFTNSEILKEVDELRESMGLKKPISVYESCEISGALVVGVFRPRILLPPGFGEGVTDGERKMALLMSWRTFGDTI